MFKYQSYLEELTNCPPHVCKSRENIVFRFVFDDINNQRNFLPPMILTPKRKIDKNDEKCDAYGLSFYLSANQAKTAYQELKKNVPKINQCIGTHIAKIPLLKSDGVCTKPSSKGHITLHEYETVDLKNRSHIIEKVYYGNN